MAKEKPEKKLCKHCQTEIPYGAKICPNCKKRVKRGPLQWAIIAIVVIIILAIIASFGGNDEDESVTKVGTVAESSAGEESVSEEATETVEDDDSTETVIAADSTDATEEDEAAEAQTEYRVGDILMDGDMKIVYMSSGVYSEDNEFLQAADGYQYIYLQFAFENQSETDSSSISYYSFDGYADGYSVDMYYSGDETLSATLSPGRSTSGYIYFEVPVDAQQIEVEYTTNFFTEDKITFIYEGEQDSGYLLEGTTEATEEAFSPGDIVETSDLKISYLSCEVDSSYSDFSQPRSGYHYVTCTFEFENIGDSDEYVSIYDFDCYADGLSCDMVYFRDDHLSATISSGHKAQGTVTFEVPDNASIVEVEYSTSYWTSDRIVFSCNE